MAGSCYNCSYCEQLLQRPITIRCGHNYCLECYEKRVADGRLTCVICSRDMPRQVRINWSLLSTMKKAMGIVSPDPSTLQHSMIYVIDRRSREFTVDIAFGQPKPIYRVVNDKKAVLIHKDGRFPVGVYGENEDDEDHGDWFLYTGRDDNNEALRVSYEKGYPVSVMRYALMTLCMNLIEYIYKFVSRIAISQITT
ncbi:putative transcription factor C2H2 family [Helianthus annuus]|nr:putative transcription factor C2H2 family [Helianthus annuus]